MVGAPSSNRCGTCKARKVKCDEAWPICGPCKKGRRYCPGPPVTQIKFVEGDRPRHELPIRSAGLAHRNRSSQSPVRGGNKTSSSASYLQMITLQATEKDGGTFQKIRLLDVGSRESSSQPEERGTPTIRSPSFSPGESLSRRLYTFLDWGSSNPKVHIHGMWLRELPRRFGTSPALDNAALCLISSHEAIIRGDNHSKWMNLHYYGKTLTEIQNAIDNPEEQFSTNTLAAVSLLWRTEGIFAVAKGIDNQPVHAQGLVHMLTVRGMRNPDDALEFLLTLDCQIAAVQYCISRDFPQPCMFDTEEWDVAFSQERHGRSDISMIYWQVFRQFIKWPGLLHDILMIYLNPDQATVPAREILIRALGVATEMELLSHKIGVALNDPKICITKPSTTADPLVPIIFEFRDTEAAPLLGYFCFYSIIIHRMIIHLSSFISTETNEGPLYQSTTIPTDIPNTFPISADYDIPKYLFSGSPSPEFPPTKSFLDTIRLRNVQLAQTVWMMYEQARMWKPVGCLFFLNALKTSFSWASPEMKDWILNAAADIEDFLPESTGWNPEKVEKMNAVVCGEMILVNENNHF